MIKNIIILILLWLLFWVWSWKITPEQIKELGNSTYSTVKNATNENIELFKNSDNTTISNVIETNGSILKEYWINNAKMLLELENWDTELKEQLLQKILLKYWLNSESWINFNNFAKEDYEKGIKEIDKLIK